jgi:glycosyltransferase involved in cell wall biosynthesis
MMPAPPTRAPARDRAAEPLEASKSTTEREHEQLDSRRRAPHLRDLHIVSVQTSGERGGAEYANVELLDALGAHGARVKLLSDQPALVAGTDVDVTKIDLGPKIKRSTLRRVALGFPRWLWRMREALAREGRDRRIDVTLLHFKKEQLMSALLPRRLTGAIVWAEWGPLPTPLTHGPARRLYAAAARRATLIVAVSQSTRASLVKAGVPAGKVVVINNIVDGEEVAFNAAARERYREEWAVTEQQLVLGCVTRLNASKRNDALVDALDYLSEDVILLFAGEGEEEGALRERAARYGPRVRFLPTPRGYVQDILSACDLAVFAPQAIEGAPRAIIFGQLCERAVIASGPEGAIDMVLPGTGTIVSPAHDPRMLAACIQTYWQDPERRTREGRAGRILARGRYDRAAVVEQWIGQLSSLAG